jgi:hypothetical protein
LIGDDRCRCNAVLSAAAWADVGRWLFADKTLVTSAAEGETAKVGVRSKVVMVLETAYWRTRQQFIVELVKEMRLMAGDAEGALIDTEAARSVVRLVNPQGCTDGKDGAAARRQHQGHRDGAGEERTEVSQDTAHSREDSRRLQQKAQRYSAVGAC